MELEEIRREIDEIDSRILSLFCRRMDAVKHVAEYKMENRMNTRSSVREAEILEKVRQQAEAGYEEYAVAFFREIMRISRQMQQKLIDEAEAQAVQEAERR